MKRSKKQSILCAIFCFVFLVTTVGGVTVSNAEESTSTETATYTGAEIKKIRVGEQTVAPIDGKVFAGFYKESTCDNALKASETPVDDTNYHAKFVAQEVLSVKCQLKVDTTAESESTDLRLLTTVDSLNYQKVGFRVSIGEATGDLTATNVYSTIYGFKTSVSSDAVLYKPYEAFASESQYFMAFKLTEFSQSNFNTPITVTPFWVTLDGIEVTGVQRSFTIQDIINAFQTGEYDPDHDYMETIEGEEYEFFIHRNSTKNSVTWDETNLAFHLDNDDTANSSSRGFWFDEDYMKNIQQHTDAIGIRFQVKCDGEINSDWTGETNLYQSYKVDNTWGWTTAGRGTKYTATQKADWITIELKFADFYKDATTGTQGAVALMNTDAGMYVRDIQPIKAGEELIDGSKMASNWFGTYNASNSVKWDATNKRFNFTNVATANTNARSFSVRPANIRSTMGDTKAIGIRFQVKSDGKTVTGYTGTDHNLYIGSFTTGTWVYPGTHGMTFDADEKADWITVEIKFADITNTANTGYMFGLMNTDAGMYVRDLSFIMP